MPTGLLVLCAITIPLGLWAIAFGFRWSRLERSPQVGIRSPGENGMIVDPVEKLRAARRIGRAAVVLGALLLAMTAGIIWQESAGIMAGIAG